LWTPFVKKENTNTNGNYKQKKRSIFSLSVYIDVCVISFYLTYLAQLKRHINTNQGQCMELSKCM